MICFACNRRAVAGCEFSPRIEYPLSTFANTAFEIDHPRNEFACYDKPGNAMTFPSAVPEIPAANVDKAAAYYVNALGFTLDWGGDQGGIAGISRGNCRLFLTNRSFRESHGNTAPVLFWLNLDSKAEVDELFAQWHAAQAKIVAAPEDKPWNLREFTAADPDGNLIRVFYDFSRDGITAQPEPEPSAAPQPPPA